MKVRESKASKEKSLAPAPALVGRMNYMFIQYVAKLIKADPMKKWYCTQESQGLFLSVTRAVLKWLSALLSRSLCVKGAYRAMGERFLKGHNCTGTGSSEAWSFPSFLLDSKTILVSHARLQHTAYPYCSSSSRVAPQHHFWCIVSIGT